ncbi:MAG: LytR C-terminal domain-containing protein [Candidatus Levybacteria bacterium]|nr:LytR C-terminal domain-containing protein [Candidatus Levybacteria bacterium]
MEEEQKDEVFQAPKEFESRINRPRSNNNVKRYLVIIVLIVVLGLLIFGVTRFFGGASKPEPTPTPIPTTETVPTEEPTPTPEETLTPTKKPTNTPTPKPTVNPIDKTTGLDRSKLSIQVLNGSGAAGASKKASDYLEGLGYNVIQIGNAENFNFEKTTIQIKSSKDDFLNLLKSDLSKNYSIGTASADLSSDQNADATVTIGKE